MKKIIKILFTLIPLFRFRPGALLLHTCGRQVLGLSIWLLWLPLSVFAQTRVLTGRTLDSRQQPVPFTTVAIPGTSLGTAADADGRFRLLVPDTLRPAAQVVASAVGYVPATARVGTFGAGE